MKERARRFAPDIGAVAAITTFVAFLSGAQQWTGFNSPDSEFYASLALFGDDVAGRALEPAYTTTRLGYIAPVRALVTVLGPWAGFAAWRFLLITVIVASLFAIVRLVSTRQLAVAVSLVGSLNTVVLSFAGNTYLTGSLLAGLLALLAFGTWGALGTPRIAWLPAAMAGAAAAWLAMVNPYGMLLGATMWIGLLALPRATGERRWRDLGRDGLAMVAGFAVMFGALLAAGLAIFPGRNWLTTYLDWNARLDYSAFVGDPDVWRRDIALLVPAAAVALAALALATARHRRVATAALVVAVLNWAFTFGYLALVPGPWLEAPTYVALLWAGGLASLALSFAAVTGRRDLGWPGWLLVGMGVPLLIWSGHSDRDVTGWQGLAIAIAIVGLTGVAFAAMRRAGDPPGRLASSALVLSLLLLAVGAQLLQNGRGLLGIYGQFPFRAAYVDFQIEDLMRSKVAAEEFVLSQTVPGDRIGVWTDVDRLTSGIAAMQLWGAYNTVGFSPTLTAGEAVRLAELRPSAIAMYAPSRDQVYAFWQSLPPQARASVPDCTTVPFLGIGSPEAHVCVTHLAWGQ